MAAAATPVAAAPDLAAVAGAAGRVVNFGAGPAALPLEVLLKAQSEMLNFNGSGMSVLELSHRSAAFEKQILDKCVADLRDLLAVPKNYKILFLQAGATAQFAAVPLNLLHHATAPAAGAAAPAAPAATAAAAGAGDAKASAKPTAEYLVTGVWSEKAAQEAGKYLTAHVVATSKKSNYTHIPDPKGWAHAPVSADAPAPLYLHYCANETVHGVEYPFVPTPKDPRTLLVADMSSNFCSKPVDISKYALIYAGAQKNVGPAGVTVVIVREDLLRNGVASSLCPSALLYRLQSDNQSMYNTPPTFTIYVMGLMFQWLKAQGGLSAIAQRNAQKAKLLYDVIDHSKLYVCPVSRECRSAMNVVFTIQTASDGAGAVAGERKLNDFLQKAFVDAAKQRGMVGVEGHRSVGGMRVSLYNAITVAEAKALADLMVQFEADHWKSVPLSPDATAGAGAGAGASPKL